MTTGQLYILTSVLLVGIGIFCLIAKKNLIQILIGIEIIAKGVTLSFVTAGYLLGNEKIAQAMVITIILIEVVTASIAMSIIVNVYKHTDSIDVKDIKRLKG